MEADRRREANLKGERERKAKEDEEARIKAEQDAAFEQQVKEELATTLRVKRARLPPEPPATDKSTIRLRLQFPHGRKSDRRFNPTDPIQVSKQVERKEEDARLSTHSLMT